jgi:putative copper export protein
VFILAGVLVFRALARSMAATSGVGASASGDWSRRIERELSVWGMFAGFALVAFDLGRVWHQTYAFYGGFEPVTLELVATITNETLWGSGWKVQAIAAAAAAVAFAAAYRRWPGAWLVALPAVAVAVVSRPLTGHATEAGSWFSLPAILQAIHVSGASVWLGTLFAMTAVGLRRARELPTSDRARVIAAMVNGFSPLALGAAMALFLAGSATSFLYLGSPAAVYGTGYGRVFAAKLLVFCAVLAIGYFNWQKVRPRLEGAAQATGDAAVAEALLLRSAGAELAVAVVVLVLTAVLVALPMPAG